MPLNLLQGGYITPVIYYKVLRIEYRASNVDQIHHNHMNLLQGVHIAPGPGVYIYDVNIDDGG